MSDATPASGPRRIGRGRRGAKKPPVVVGIPEERRLGALASAFRQGIRTPFIVANASGAIVGFILLVIAGQPQLAIPLLFRIPFAVASFAVVACLLLPFLVRGPIRAGLESFAWIGRWDALRWAQATGARPLASPEQARDWLESHPEDPAATPLQRLARIEPCLLVGDIAAARRLAASLPTGTPWDRFDTAYQKAFVEFMGGARLDSRPYRTMARALTDPEERLRGAAFVAVGEARVALADGKDWLSPLVEVRPVIGEVAEGVLRLEVWPTMFRLEIVLSLIIGLVLALVVTIG